MKRDDALRQLVEWIRKMWSIAMRLRISIPGDIAQKAMNQYRLFVEVMIFAADIVWLGYVVACLAEAAAFFAAEIGGRFYGQKYDRLWKSP